MVTRIWQNQLNELCVLMILIIDVICYRMGVFSPPNGLLMKLHKKGVLLESGVFSLTIQMDQAQRFLEYVMFHLYNKYFFYH